MNWATVSFFHIEVFLVKREEKFARIFCSHIFSYPFDINSDEKFIPLNRQKKIIFERFSDYFIYG